MQKVEGVRMTTLGVALWLCVVGVVNGSPFRPTRTGGATPALFWYPNDNGVVVPALLHGRRSPSPRGIADDVQFYFYDSRYPSALPMQLSPGCSNCLSVLIPGAPVVLLVHGFSSSYQGGFGDGLRANFAKASTPMNLIFVNWERLAVAPWYETAADNTKPVGQWTAQLIQFIVSSGAAEIGQFHFAGHSLGSHVANFIATNLTGGLRLPRVHALDPALPLFGIRPDSERIDPSDGDFVNVIHSAMGTLLDGGLAFTEPRGHTDFYPNSGAHQPGCGVDAFGACSHSRAHEYFGESVHRPNTFEACECEDWDHYNGACGCSHAQPMGWGTPSTSRGIFYLKTRATSPYGLGP